MNDKEKLVRDLVGTFDNRSALHQAYKERMKEIIIEALACITVDILENTEEEMDVEKWVHEFVEERCRIQQSTTPP